jgi:hypothetical protein
MPLRKMSPAAFISLIALTIIVSCSEPDVGGLNDPSNFSAEAGVTSVTLAWTPVTGATGYTLERVEGSGANVQLVANEDKRGFLDTGLQPNTTYTYRVKATNGSASSTGKTATATTRGEGTPVSITTLKPVWRSKTPVNSFTEGQEISAVKNAADNVSDLATTINNHVLLGRHLQQVHRLSIWFWHV